MDVHGCYVGCVEERRTRAFTCICWPQYRLGTKIWGTHPPLPSERAKSQSTEHRSWEECFSGRGLED